jgi:hypothetical protein
LTKTATAATLRSILDLLIGQDEKWDEHINSLNKAAKQLPLMRRLLLHRSAKLGLEGGDT